MPDYLLSRNKLFDQMIETILTITSPMDMDGLRQMAFFLHQRMDFDKASRSMVNLFTSWNRSVERR